MATKAKYWMSNGYHNTTTYVLVAPKVGAKVSARAMTRARIALCGMADCSCNSSCASNPRDGQRDGFDAHPTLLLDHDPREVNACVVIDATTA